MRSDLIIIMVRDSTGKTGLDLIVERRLHDLLRYIIEKTASRLHYMIKSAVGTSIFTKLVFCIRSGDFEMFKMIFDFFNQKSNNGELNFPLASLIEFALKHARLDILRLILSESNIVSFEMIREIQRKSDRFYFSGAGMALLRSKQVELLEKEKHDEVVRRIAAYEAGEEDSEEF